MITRIQTRHAMTSSIELPLYAASTAKGNDSHLVDLDEEDGGGAELAGLISRSRFGVAPQHALHRRRRSDGGEDGANAKSCLQLIVSFAFLVGVVIYGVDSFSGGGGNGRGSSEHPPPIGHDPIASRSPPSAAAAHNNDNNKGNMPKLVAGDASTYQCQADVERPSSAIHQLSARHNKTLTDLKKGKLEGWGISYSKLKKILASWKKEVFVPNVRSGDLIFESACGAGTNLLVTAEILRENSIDNIQVFGNDYVVVADQTWDSEEVSKLARKGRFCPGDSSRLADFVPASSFDLAYTGYLVPLIPKFPNAETEEASWNYAISLCNSTDPNDVRLRDREQRTQEEWISAWVKGLLHIVKPGKVVALENVAYPLCSIEGGRDWGGVSKEWWAGAIARYGWDADPKSLLIRDEGRVKGWIENRYHVMMRKKATAQAPSVGGASPSQIGQMTCPTNVEKSANDQADDFDLYVKDANAHKNITFNEEFRAMTLDGWGITLNEVKELLRPWKEKVFVENIEPGDSVYESAMGIGMNLVISAEILKENNIDGLTLSGNDYMAESIAIANSVWDENKDLKQLAHKGFFCRADSSHLDYIPDNRFDFVYTGYIDPIVDPLHVLPASLTVEEKWAKDVKLCKSDDKKRQRLAKKAQKAQNEWFAGWVEHLIRIAKPGKVIAIESGAESLCTNPEDWGGVDKSWWKGAISTYRWDVDPTSLYFQDISPQGNWKDTRYHVMMRKNG